MKGRWQLHDLSVSSEMLVGVVVKLSIPTVEEILWGWMMNAQSCRWKRTYSCLCARTYIVRWSRIIGLKILTLRKYLFKSSPPEAISSPSTVFHIHWSSRMSMGGLMKTLWSTSAHCAWQRDGKPPKGHERAFFYYWECLSTCASRGLG